MINLSELEAMVEQGYIRKVVHPRGHLELFNYSEKTTYESLWNDTTRQCRGLILDLGGNVVARPFRKFFGYSEPNAPELDLDAPVAVTDKLDGSMATLYYDGTAWSFATRGSFMSDQAIHATEVWRERYESAWLPPAGTTCIFEVVYPANRIVVNYGDLDDLILLGARDIATGDEVDSRILEWPGPATEVHPYATLREALEAPPRPGQEGLVVFFPDSGDRLKLKQEDYVYQHRLLTGLTARRIWERCAIHATLEVHPGMQIKIIARQLHLDVNDAQAFVDAGDGWLDELHQNALEEFAEWVDKTVSDLRQAAETTEREVLQIASGLRGMERKDAAREIATHPLRGLIFGSLDGKPVTAQVWSMIRPEHERPYRIEIESDP